MRGSGEGLMWGTLLSGGLCGLVTADPYKPVSWLGGGSWQMLVLRIK